MRADVAPRAAFPDYVLPEHTKTLRRLSELQGNELMVLVLTAAASPEAPAASKRPGALLSGASS